MKIKDLINPPQWLLEAVTADEDVNIVNGVVHWRSGTFSYGVFEGVFHSGTFSNSAFTGGKFCEGTFTNSRFINGVFMSGTFINSTFIYGTFANGLFINSEWVGGYFKSGNITNSKITATCAKHIPSLTAKGRINIGTYTKSTEEWDEFFSGNESLDVSRGSKQFLQIHAAYEAIKAYKRVMEQTP